MHGPVRAASWQQAHQNPTPSPPPDQPTPNRDARGNGPHAQDRQGGPQDPHHPPEADRAAAARRARGGRAGVVQGHQAQPHAALGGEAAGDARVVQVPRAAARGGPARVQGAQEAPEAAVMGRGEGARGLVRLVDGGWRGACNEVASVWPLCCRG